MPPPRISKTVRQGEGFREEFISTAVEAGVSDMTGGSLEAVPRPFDGSPGVAFEATAVIVDGAARKWRLQINDGDIRASRWRTPVVSVLFTPAGGGSPRDILDIDFTILEART